MDSNCLDIGAHRGEWLTFFRKFAPAGQHIAVEPLPHLAAMLRENFPDVEVHECALAAGQGMAQFVHAVDIEGWSGLQRQDYPVDTREERFDVVVRRLDDIVGERDIAFVKVDVEGAEFIVLDGGKEFLSRCRPHVFFELAHVHASAYEVTPEQMHELLASCHLRVETLAGRPLTAEDLRTVYDHAHQIGYGRSAQTNFLAVPA